MPSVLLASAKKWVAVAFAAVMACGAVGCSAQGSGSQSLISSESSSTSAHSASSSSRSSSSASSASGSSSQSSSSSSSAAASSSASASTAASSDQEADASVDEVAEKRDELFAEMLLAYQEVEQTGDINNLPNSPVRVNIEAFDPYASSGELVYAYYDVSGDGGSELLVGRNIDGTVGLFDLLGVDSNGSIARVGDFTGYRSYCAICEDGVLRYDGSSGAATGEVRYMRLPQGSNKPELIEKVVWDFEGSMDNVIYTYTGADGNSHICEPELIDEIAADYVQIANFEWMPLLGYSPNGSVPDPGQELVGSAQAESALAEEVAVAFVEQYYTNTVVPDMNDQTTIETISNWQEVVLSYLAPGSSAEAKFYSEVVNTPLGENGGGLGAACVVVGSTVERVNGNEVEVLVDYCGTQNYTPDWINDANKHTVRFVCTVNPDGMVDTYTMQSV